jgi:hypothetical protein
MTSPVGQPMQLAAGDDPLHLIFKIIGLMGMKGARLFPPTAQVFCPKGHARQGIFPTLALCHKNRFQHC